MAALAWRRGVGRLGERLYGSSAHSDLNSDISVYLPQTDCVLPRADKWAFGDKDERSVDHAATWRVGSEFLSSVHRGDTQKAWEAFKRFPATEKGLIRSMVWAGASGFPRFINMLTSENFDYSRPWKRAQEIKAAADFVSQRNYKEFEFSANDYAPLLTLAGKAGDLATVEKIWTEIEQNSIPRNTNVWNQYISIMCDTDVKNWPHENKQAGSKNARIVNAMLDSTQTVANPARFEQLKNDMLNDGVMPNSRTKELEMLAAARQHDMKKVQIVIMDTWIRPDGAVLPQDSPFAPTLSTAHAIIDAFAFNNETEIGYKAVQTLNKRYPHSVPLGAIDARRLWIRILRSFRVQTEPRGPISRTKFGNVWNDMVETYKYKPTSGHWTINVEFLEWKNQFHEIAETIGHILGLAQNGDAHGGELARSALSRAVVGFGNTGRIEESIMLLQLWADRGLDMRRELLPFVRSHVGERERLGLHDLVDEDDDEDESILGY